ncbi:MAG: hypothetical protein ACOVQA_03735 [Thermoflexibacteraceae bacterium]
MKSIFYIFTGLVFILLVGCKEENKTTPIVRYNVPAGISALNASIDGIKFNIANYPDQIGVWSFSALSGTTISSGKINGIFYTNNFTKTEKQGDNTVEARFNFHPPYLLLNDVSTEYTYERMVQHFKVGKQAFQVFPQPLGSGFRLSVSYLDLSLKEPSFSFETQSGSQEGSKCEIVKVSPLPNNGILVTYEIDCKIYSITNVDYKRASRFVGTVQVVYYHKQF